MKYSTKTLSELKENCKYNTCETCIVRSVCSEIRDTLGDNKDYPRDWTYGDILIMAIPQTKFHCYIPPCPEKENIYTNDNIVKALEFARKTCMEDNESQGNCSLCPLSKDDDSCMLVDIINGAPDELTDKDILDISLFLDSMEPKQEILDIIEYISGFNHSGITEVHSLNTDSYSQVDMSEFLKVAHETIQKYFKNLGKSIYSKPTYISAKEFEDNFISNKPMTYKFLSDLKKAVKQYLKDLMDSITKTQLEQALKEPYIYEEAKKALEEARNRCIKRNGSFLGCSGCQYNVNQHCELDQINYWFPLEWNSQDIENILNKYFPEPEEIPELITNAIDKQRLEEQLPF